MTRDAQTDTCHGTCEADCSVCNAIYEPNFKPVDVRMTMMGAPDPKLVGTGDPGSNTYR